MDRSIQAPLPKLGQKKVRQYCKTFFEMAPETDSNVLRNLLKVRACDGYKAPSNRSVLRLDKWLFKYLLRGHFRRENIVLQRAERIRTHTQQRKDKNKHYALHARSRFTGANSRP